MNNTLKDIRLTSEDEYPSTTSTVMIMSNRTTISMPHAAIAFALMIANLSTGCGFQPPQGVIQSFVTPPASIAYGRARGEGIVTRFLPRNSFHTRGHTRIVQHTSLMSSLLEDTSPLPKVARSVTKVKGKTRVKNHKAPLSNIEEEA